MIGFSEILPMYPGYALGGVISEPDLYLPLFEKKRVALEEELLNAEAAKKSETDSPQFKVMDEDTRQKILNNHASKILNITRNLSVICGKISELWQVTNFFPVQETLPFDDSFVKLRNENRSFKAERLHHLVFTNKDHVHSQVQAFISQLFLHDVPTSILPMGTLESFTKIIEMVLGTSKTTVALVGSFISLERVKIIDPLVLRPHSRLSDDLLQNASKYFVLTEAVLGAVFLGIGRDFRSEGLSSAVSDQKLLSTLTTIQFISQGAIPKLNPKIEDVNLWNVYVEWKAALADPQSGYPIGFKVRKLQNVLRENEVHQIT